MKRCVWLLTVLGVGGCVPELKSDAPPLQIYVLNPAPATAQAGEVLAVHLAIASPRAAPGLDTDRIVLIRRAREMDYYAGSRWADKAPRVVQDWLIRGFQDRAVVRSVGAEPLRGERNYLLRIVVQDFQAEYREARAKPVVRVRLAVQLLDMGSRNLVAGFHSEQRIEASANTLGAVLDAFDEALGAVADEVISATLQRLGEAVES